ncbi:GntR family transcriptional regulator [Rhodococcus sp. DMU1]|uniref:FadR/GntR family transcriptional regulator n=1 Tax=Rhodococcus sp. DMU1 TaxID=2722825 RepID=UPI00143EC945|nr:GntR family transcriptional regulator [Rhodococcus sp. DMU1]QIX53751.1 FadR family transcriptional regulator [Rhodococcus sp. DMU1]
MVSVGAESSLVRIPKAGELVASQLRRQIVTGELEEGEPLPSESALMARYGVSRPTLREAFRILESESIIVVLRGAHGGARVLAPDESVAARHMGLLLQYQGVALADVYRARTEIEIAALRSWSGSESDLEKLTELVEEGRGLLGDPVEFAKLDTRVHQAIVDSAGSRTMSVMMGMLLYIMDAHNRLYIRTHGPEHELAVDQLAYRSYRRLLKLLGAGDVDSAVTHWQRHLHKVATHMLDESGTTLVEVLS